MVPISNALCEHCIVLERHAIRKDDGGTCATVILELHECTHFSPDPNRAPALGQTPHHLCVFDDPSGSAQRQPLQQNLLWMSAAGNHNHDVRGFVKQVLREISSQDPKVAPGLPDPAPAAAVAGDEASNSGQLQKFEERTLVYP